MPMLSVECFSCHNMFALRGWVEPEDLVGTKWEGYTQALIEKAERENPFIFQDLDPWSQFDQNLVCPNCGSANVISY